MARPGVNIVDAIVSPGGAPVGESGRWFIAGVTERGLVDTPVAVRSLRAFEREFGPRVSSSSMWDAVDVFFREGGGEAIVSRVVGPSALPSTITLNDGGAHASIKVSAVSPGVWGDALTVTVTAGTGNVTLTVKEGTRVVAVSPTVDDQMLLDEWVNPYVRVEGDSGGTLPVAAVDQALTGGTDDRGNITGTEWTSAVDAFSVDMGPGQVSAPGAANNTVYGVLRAHAANNNRVAYLDAVAGLDAAALQSAVVGLRTDDTEANRGGYFAPWLRVPGVIPNTSRLVPPSAVVAAKTAAADRAASTAQPPAGGYGMLTYSLGPDQEFTDVDYTDLNDAGVNMIRVMPNGPQVYGFRSLGAYPGLWWQLTAARSRMMVEASAYRIASRYVFRPIDGQGHLIGEFQGDLLGMLADYWAAGVLFGESAQDASSVDVGVGVNPPEDLADGILRATLAVRLSPFTELVEITIGVRAVA